MSVRLQIFSNDNPELYLRELKRYTNYYLLTVPQLALFLLITGCFE
jgi:hypothetical protein